MSVQDIPHIVAVPKICVADDPDDLRAASFGAQFGALHGKRGFTHGTQAIRPRLVVRLLTFDIDGTPDIVSSRSVRQEIVEEILMVPNRNRPQVMMCITNRECGIQSFLVLP
jgi:hypothetical protein